HTTWQSPTSWPSRLPKSIHQPPGRSTAPPRPPTVSAWSRRTTRLPCRVRIAPATSPASAAPTITTSVSRSPVMAASAQEGVEALLEGGAAEVPDGRGGADGRGEREMVPRLRLRDVQAGQELEVQVAVVGLAQEAHLAGQVAGDQARGVALDDGRRVRQPGRQRGDGGLDVMIHVLRPQAELLGRELALEEDGEEAALDRMGLLEGEALVQ